MLGVMHLSHQPGTPALQFHDQPIPTTAGLQFWYYLESATSS